MKQDNAKIEQIISVIEKMETDIIQGRKQSQKGGRSLFSYHLYALRVEGYRSAKSQKVSDLKKRLEDIVKQYLINIEDNPADEKLCARCRIALTEAEQWLKQL